VGNRHSRRESDMIRGRGRGVGNRHSRRESDMIRGRGRGVWNRHSRRESDMIRWARVTREYVGIARRHHQ